MSSGVLSESAPPRISSRLRARIFDALPLVVFACAVLLLWPLYGNRLILGTNDEGIYLDAAERLLHGQKLYVDFFGYMSPGSFWTQALAFRLFGLTLAAGRAPVIVYVALECALIYWLVARYASRATAIVTTLFFLAFQTADPSMITAQHRWDSSALSLASICAFLSERRRGYAASGFLIGCAALATPSVALVAIVTLAWHRSRAPWYLLGASLAALAAGVALWLDGILPAFIRQLGWLSRNYSAVNAMHYGSIIGGYGPLFAGATAWELPVRCCVIFCIALPAVLPVVAIAGGILLRVRGKSHSEPLRSVIPYLVLCVSALVASTYPRSDVAHLAYIAALPYAAAAIVLYRCLTARPRASLAILIAPWAALFAMQPQLAGSIMRLHTPVGEVRASAAEAPLLGELLSRVQPHQSLFVYPYKPLFYFLTQAENPTRYSYLAPGMMGDADSRLALRELQAHPPEWVLYLDLNQAEFERVFPSGKNFDAHFPALEDWIKANYRPSATAPLGGYVLLERRAPFGP